MPVLEIRKAGDKILKEVAAPIEKIDRKIKQLLDDMAETMYAADGVGLAAPQVGVSLQLVVIDVGEGIIELINPKIIAYEGSEVGTEGCLSVPGMYGEVERYAAVTVEALNRSGKKIRINGSGLLARALQHETDHLKGILFIELAKTLHKG
ncbi:peptide deformylase [Sporomusa acidovorans]|uniref:Peptide deformylase n=1 Tax=Sporomusa acidovorans (strain ATCC 49682 / DSM 3132 / Mol) TaxID=1123286 RepID=A0ABZ3J2X2_SPOA4|nr:peptide deformylase [Sporomusa acidovorans]OZC20225.1 peptide deformylase 1 [Sporomusa acidovorans DSM 3132]SDD41384.1 peptide deformylase [Sporomusa acidovorans]